MLSPQLRQQIFKLWTSFWSSGMTNPITAIEQITYLLFIKQLERQDAEHVEDGKKTIYDSETDPRRWSQLYKLDNPYDVLTGQVFPWLRTLNQTIKDRWGDDEDDGLEVAEYLEDAFFQLPKEKTGVLRESLDAVNDLFNSTGSQNADLMGDIFEYLLDQLNTSGKNGQFRTPRHIIRFMLELVDPQQGSRLVDPAGGTAGFLTNAILHYRKKRTPESQLRLEWDGSPHNLSNGYKPTGEEFNGFDNDRTMVRIGWMNMILHGITHPRYKQRDPLGKGFSPEESNKYDYAFANPPYSGSVDTKDLHPTRFPRKSPKSSDPITDSSELLFVWVMLDMLKPGGTMAIIVPEGLLFGSTSAHRMLRRTLLHDHVVEGVISLPQGVFNPYTGVKTSILVVRKCEAPSSDTGLEKTPQTDKVWFYEVASDGFNLGANRTAQPLKPNDLWDALEKWKRRNDPTPNTDEKTYYQPEIHKERWRLVDETVVKLFPEAAGHNGQVLAIHEILPAAFPPPFNLLAAEQEALEEAAPLLPGLFERVFAQQSFARKKDFDPAQTTKEQLRQALNRLRSLLTNHEYEGKTSLYQREEMGSYADEHGRDLLRLAVEPLSPPSDDAQPLDGPLLKQISGLTKEELTALSKAGEPDATETLPLIRLFARLDGFDIYLRSVGVFLQPKELPEPKCWTVPLRQWRVRPNWTPPTLKDNPVGKGNKKETEIKGSHDQSGKVRPEYMAAAFDAKTGLIDPEYLDPECIEANDFNLSAGRYKPLQASSEVVEAGTTANMLRELLKMEEDIRNELQKLLDMVEGKA